MLLRILTISVFFISSHGTYAEVMNVMNDEMAGVKSKLETKCRGGAVQVLTSDLFSSLNSYGNFIKSMDDLLIARPNNACDLLRHPRIFSVVSVLPQLSYEEKEKTYSANKTEEIEIEYSRKFYISKILELKEKFPVIEKYSILKNRAKDSEEFYLKGLIACFDLKCPEKIYSTILAKIPKDSPHVVYGKNIKEFLLENNMIEEFFRLNFYFSDVVDLSYNKSEALKKLLSTDHEAKDLKKISDYVHPSHFAVINPTDWKKIYISSGEKIDNSIVLNELESRGFISKNVIGFANPSSELIHYAIYWGATSEENKKVNKIMEDRYKAEKIIYSKPDWKGDVVKAKLEDIRQTEIKYEVGYYNVYGAVNNENGNWFLVKNKENKDYWIHRSQFYNSVSISSIVSKSNLPEGLQYYESPGGTMSKKLTQDHTGIRAKSYKWIGDQLWVLVDAYLDDGCSEGGEKPSSFLPVSDLWIKVFNDNGGTNFLYYSRGC